MPPLVSYHWSLVTVLQKGVDALAFLYAVLMFPAPLFWLILHPAIHFWRRLGNQSYWVALPLWIASGTALVLLRQRIFAERISRNPETWILGSVVVLLAFGMDRRTRREFGWRRLVGLPELNPADPRAGVVSRGIYSYVRHPRYLQYMLMFWGLALLSGTKGFFLLAILTVLLYLIVVPLEERELREQYGSPYEAYARQVPRFVPRLRRRMKPHVSS
jgi:protein-S-isoprenylcysteine O-methyltransferase Ste14